MYDKILVPLDGSKRAEAVLHHVADLAQRYHAKVIFLQVIDPGAVVSGMGGSYTVADTGVIQRLVGDADRYLRRGAASFAARVSPQSSASATATSCRASFPSPKARVSIWWRWPAMAGAACVASSTAAWRRAC